MEYLVGVDVPCLAPHEQTRVALYRENSSSLEETACCAASQPFRSPFYGELQRFEYPLPACVRSRTSNAVLDLTADDCHDCSNKHEECHSSLAPISPLLAEQSDVLVGSCSLFAPQPLGMSPLSGTRFDDPRQRPLESHTPIVTRTDTTCSTVTYPSAVSQVDGVSFTTLSTIFSSPPTWGEISACSDELRVLMPLAVGGNTPFLQPHPVVPVGEQTEDLEMPCVAGPWVPKESSTDWMNTTVRTLFLSLTEDAEEMAANSSELNGPAPPSSRRNTVELLMAQLTEGSDRASRKARGPFPVSLSSQMDIQATSIGSVGVSGLTPDSAAALPERMMAGRTDFSLGAPRYRAPPCAVGCSPPGSPCRELRREDADLGEWGWHHSSIADLPGAVRVVGGRHVGRFNCVPLNAPRLPVVDRAALSDVHRNTPQALRLKAMINNSCLDGVLMTSGWPLRTKSDVVTLLKRLRAKELLRHLRIISFSRRDPQGVRILFESWVSKGIPPPDVLFGVYYRYAVKKCGKEMCLKHNGRGRAAGHGRGCDYALKGSLFKCRFHHACVFCKAVDHGWFDEANCARYLKLQRELVDFGVTSAVAMVLLDALECGECPTPRNAVT